MGYGIPEPPFSWNCSFCNQHSTIIENNFLDNTTFFTLGNHKNAVVIYFILCPNPKCKKFTLTLSLHKAAFQYKWQRWIVSEMIEKRRIVPPSEGKIFPDYIPKAIRDDYLEACLIRDLSPKASATLARRSFQGMIRDFWKVKKSNLKQEIEAIKDKVDSTTWKAIDAVREVGNIGAHMEQDINVIIEVEPNEANLLTNLIEILMKDWYIAKHEREESLRSIAKLGQSKKAQKKKNSASLKEIVIPSEK